MDNASNNDTTNTELACILPSFRGLLWRIRCILHILNLIAKAILAHFTKAAKRAKPADSIDSHPDLDENAEDDDSEDLDLNSTAVADEEDEQSMVSTAQLIHNTGVTKSIQARAIAQMVAKDVHITIAAQKQVKYRHLIHNQKLILIHQVSGFARWIHDSSSVLKPEFEHLVTSSPDLNTNKTALSRRVATHWNSEYSCLDDHITLRHPVEALTGQTKHKLGAYRPNGLYQLSYATCSSLKVVHDSASSPKGKPISPVIRVAVHSGILVAEKYFKLFGKCEVYAIAIVMSPEKKLQWFGNHRWSQEEIAKVTERVLNCWSESYMHLPTVAQASSTISVAPAPMLVNLV
ncbi:hypothetical protein BT96DRAFT_1091397 [Gymnopus androsaceus JB14]|uniref:hAT-like transposase RNase-H fold domain-containing protein n=1 Tax=Gymnopus androsaceus JB14 TaxID=1447944 RepID=A0A6A4HTF7_9AGAR|nr:hypothetical protein BT96DRAFT_1091397 [Gymnopus androsaceus JB14]